ncbi:MAG: flagellar hook-length control protein FliK, partial [Fimbriimonadaceae bacterium]
PASQGGAPPNTPHLTSQGLQHGMPDVPKPHGDGASARVPRPNSQGLQLGMPDVPKPASNGSTITIVPQPASQGVAPPNGSQLTSQGLQHGMPDVPQPASNGSTITIVPQPVSQGVAPPNGPQLTSQGLQHGMPDVPKPHGDGASARVPRPNSQGLQHGMTDVPKPASNGSTITIVPQPASQGVAPPNGSQLTSQGLQHGMTDVPKPASNGSTITIVPQPVSQGGAPPNAPQLTSQGLQLGMPDLPSLTSGWQQAAPVATNHDQPQPAKEAPTETGVGPRPLQASDSRATGPNPAVELPKPTSGATVSASDLGALKSEGIKANAKAKNETTDQDALLGKKPEVASQPSATVTQFEAAPPRTLAPAVAKETVQQVREAFAHLIGQAGIHTAAVTLADEALGEVRIRVTSRGKRINAEIAAADEAVRTLLRTHRQEFELAVTQKGFELGSFQTHSDGGSPKQAQAPTAHTPVGSSHGQEPAPTTATRPLTSDTGLDVVI